MDKKIVENIRKNMEPKSTEELQQIYEKNDRNQYSEEAFEAIRQLLVEREKTPPPQQAQPQNIQEINNQSGGFFSFAQW